MVQDLQAHAHPLYPEAQSIFPNRGYNQVNTHQANDEHLHMHDHITCRIYKTLFTGHHYLLVILTSSTILLIAVSIASVR